MIYIKTKFGWWYTGKEEIGQCFIAWNQVALAYFDSVEDDFVWPLAARQRMNGINRIDARTKLQMWTMGKDYPLFDFNKHLDIVTRK